MTPGPCLLRQRGPAIAPGPGSDLPRENFRDFVSLHGPNRKSTRHIALRHGNNQWFATSFGNFSRSAAWLAIMLRAKTKLILRRSQPVLDGQDSSVFLVCLEFESGVPQGCGKIARNLGRDRGFRSRG